MTYSEGDRVCTVARDGSRMAGVGTMHWPIWIGGIYEAKRRVRDGVLTWRRVDSFGDTRSGNSPRAKFVAELKAAATPPDLR